MTTHLVYLTASLILVGIVPAPTVKGKVVSVAEGDTLTVLQGTQEWKIRVKGIDAPDPGQPFSVRAKKFVSDLCLGKTVTVLVCGYERGGPVLGPVTLPDGTDLGAEVVRAGFAWWYKPFAHPVEGYGRLEDEARRAKRGLWSIPNPIPPWEWRAAREKWKLPAGWQ